MTLPIRTAKNEHGDRMLIMVIKNIYIPYLYNEEVDMIEQRPKNYKT